jgi:hypothetical protein
MICSSSFLGSGVVRQSAGDTLKDLQQPGGSYEFMARKSQEKSTASKSNGMREVSEMNELEMTRITVRVLWLFFYFTHQFLHGSIRIVGSDIRNRPNL